jgi:hypothetical protein
MSKQQTVGCKIVTRSLSATGSKSDVRVESDPHLPLTRGSNRDPIKDDQGASGNSSRQLNPRGASSCWFQCMAETIIFQVAEQRVMLSRDVSIPRISTTDDNI